MTREELNSTLSSIRSSLISIETSESKNKLSEMSQLETQLNAHPAEVLTKRMEEVSIEDIVSIDCAIVRANDVNKLDDVRVGDASNAMKLLFQGLL